MLRFNPTGLKVIHLIQFGRSHFISQYLYSQYHSINRAGYEECTRTISDISPPQHDPIAEALSNAKTKPLFCFCVNIMKSCHTNSILSPDMILTNLRGWEPLVPLTDNPLSHFLQVILRSGQYICSRYVPRRWGGGPTPQRQVTWFRSDSLH